MMNCKTYELFSLVTCIHGTSCVSVKSFEIHAYSDKTFLFATRETHEHCSMDSTVTLLYVV